MLPDRNQGQSSGAGAGPVQAWLDRALELSPNNAEVLGISALFASYTGEHEEAIMLAEHAVELDPLNVNLGGLYALGVVNERAGNTEAAVAAFSKLTQLASSPIASVHLAIIEVARRNLDEAERSLRLQVDHPGRKPVAL